MWGLSPSLIGRVESSLCWLILLIEIQWRKKVPPPHSQLLSGSKRDCSSISTANSSARFLSQASHQTHSGRSHAPLDKECVYLSSCRNQRRNTVVEKILPRPLRLSREQFLAQPGWPLQAARVHTMPFWTSDTVNFQFDFGINCFHKCFFFVVSTYLMPLLRVCFGP